MSIFLGAAEDVGRIRTALSTLIKSAQSDRATISWPEHHAATFREMLETLQFPASIQTKRPFALAFTGRLEALGRTVELCLEIMIDEIKTGANGIGIVAFYLPEENEPLYRFRLGATGDVSEDSAQPSWKGHVSSEQEAQRVFLRAMTALATRLRLQP